MISHKNLHIIDHPLLKHKLTFLRNKNTPTKVFWEIVNEMALILIYEGTKDLQLKTVKTDTWSGVVDSQLIHDGSVSIAPIIRAGVGMLNAARTFFPTATVNFLGIFRDEDTIEPVVYYDKVKKNVSGNTVLILDPMLATGGTTTKTVSMLIDKGYSDFKIISIIASQEGVKNILAEHSHVDIYCAALDPKLDNNKFILPGLGDAGDRIYGT